MYGKKGKGDEGNCANYRGINLLSVLVKLFSRVVTLCQRVKNI